MSMVDRAGRKPHCFSGSICCASQKSLLWDFLPSPHTDENGVEMLEDDGFAGRVVHFE